MLAYLSLKRYNSHEVLLMNNKFKDIRITDNFYQSSSFFPMPLTLIGTLNEDGSLTSYGAYSLIFPYYIAGKGFYAMVLECRNTSNTAKGLLRHGKCTINFLPYSKKNFAQHVDCGFPGDTPEEKMKNEHEAIKKVLGDLIKKEEYFALLMEFDERKTREAVFAYHCDKLDADIQAKIYQDMGCQNSLDKQENNVVFKSKRVQQMVQNGAKTAFDIWYEWDKSLYADDENFAALLDYVKERNTQTDF